VYNLPSSLKQSVEEMVLEPSVTRTLASSRAEEASLKKKRQHDGKVNSECRIFMDRMSRIYVLQNITVDTAKLHIFDAQYGSVLLSLIHI